MSVPMSAAINAPTHSPWGHVDSCETIAPGIWCVETAGHGGIVLSEERAAMIPAEAVPFTGSRIEWEEDVDWAVPFVVFYAEMISAWSVTRSRCATAVDIHVRKALEWRRDGSKDILIELYEKNRASYEAGLPVKSGPSA